MLEFLNEQIQLQYNEICLQYMQLKGSPDSMILKVIEKEDSKFFRILLFNLYMQSTCFSFDNQIIQKIFKNIIEKQETLIFQNQSQQIILDLYFQTCISLSKYNFIETIQIYKQILEIDHYDLFALRSITNLSIFLGLADQQKQFLSQFENKYQDTIYLEYFLAIQSFFLEENGEYELAEIYAQKCLQINRDNVWAIHTIAHIFEMKKQYKQGCNFLQNCQNSWKNTNLECHVAWHLTIFLQEIGQIQESIYIYETYMIKSHSQPVLNLVDACQFLQKLENYQVKCLDYQEKWKQLQIMFTEYENLHIILLNDICQLITYIKFDQNFSEQYFMKILQYCDQLDNDYTKSMKISGIKIFQSIIFYFEQKYDQCYDILSKFQSQMYKIGGSNAQRLFLQSILQKCQKQII